MAKRVEKPVIIHMTSEQWSNGQMLPSIHLTTEGSMSEENGIWEVGYDESEATGMAGTRTKISWSPSGFVRLKRSGSVEMDMVFRTGHHHRSEIAMPYGTLSFQLTTNEASGHLDEAGGNVSLSYSLDFSKDAVISTNLKLVVTADRPFRALQ